MRLIHAEKSPQKQLNSLFKIICIDDDTGIIMALKSFLGREGYTVFGFTDYNEGIESIRSNEYDLLILDYLLDGASGDYVVKRIREFNNELHILLLTGHSQTVPPLDTLENNNIQGYCSKSDDSSQLLLWVKSAYKSIQMANEMKRIRDNMNNYLKEKVAEQTEEIKLLLDNTEEGFLYFAKDLLIKDQYSFECSKIFNKDITRTLIHDLIYPTEQADNEFLKKLLISIFEENDTEKQNIYITLLPEEFKVNERYINIKFKMIDKSPISNIDDKLMMAMLFDITEKRELQNKIQANIFHMEMVVKIVTNHEMFLECINDYTDFFQYKIFENIASSKILKDTVIDIFRAIHTYKGNFSQVKMLNTSKKLHEIETEINELINKNKFDTLEKITWYFKTKNMVSFIDADLEILKGILGEEYFNKSENITISNKKLEEIENMIKSLAPPEISCILIKELRQLKFKPLKSLLKSYAKFTYELSIKEGKDIYPFEITGDEVSVDIERFKDFYNSLIHVFRNIIAHGIEDKDERIRNNKDVIGRASCTIERKTNKFKLIISDDGIGIDPSVIRSKCVELGLCNNKTADLIPDNEIINYIFEPGFSFKNVVTELAGRGVGLVSVKKEVEKLGGTLVLESSSCKGTSFIFTFDL